MKRIFLFLLFNMVLFSLHAQDLQALQQAAIQNNRKLQSSRIAVQMAQEDRKQAFTNYFPSIQAAGGVFQGFHHLVQVDVGESLFAQFGLPPITISAIKKGALVNAMAVQPVFAGGQIVNGNRLARLQEEIRQLQLQMSERDVSLQVARLYWQIVALKANIGTLDAADRQLAEVHKFTSDYAAAGLTTRNDVLRVELKQQELASSRLQLQNGIALSEMALAQLCGAPSAPSASSATVPAASPAGSAPVPEVSPAGSAIVPAVSPAGSATVPAVSPAGSAAVPAVSPVGSAPVPAVSPAGSCSERSPIDSLISLIGADTTQLAAVSTPLPLGEGLGAAQRIESLLSRKAVDAAALQVKMERGKYMPTAAIGISDMYYNMMAKNVNNGVVFATVAVPISAWWGGSHAIRKAKLAQQQAANDYEDTVEKLRLDNQSAWNNLQESLSQITIAEKSIVSAEENLRMSLDQYKAGTLPLIDLLDAQTLRQQAADRLIEARANYQLRLAEYESKVNP